MPDIDWTLPIGAVFPVISTTAPDASLHVCLIHACLVRRVLAHLCDMEDAGMPQGWPPRSHCKQTCARAEPVAVTSRTVSRNSTTQRDVTRVWQAWTRSTAWSGLGIGRG